jgi:NAD(P)-dependent dehydrogenase (short-subunit alcohol dehydrogenase family)
MSLFAPGGVAVITGAANGIGRAAAEIFAPRGLKLVLFDRDSAGLESLAAKLPGETRILVGDASREEDLLRLKDVAYDAFGAVTILMNNAGVEGRSEAWRHLDRWRNVIGVNLWGVVYGVHAFAEAMLAQGAPAAIINTGSKQGITNPPGDPAYAVSKAGIRAYTEQLAHALRNEPGSQVSAHLLVPGWTYTGIGNRRPAEKPAGAWTPEQVIERMIPSVEAGDFYIYCPDNAVSEELDALRLQWSIGDIVENRPALSRWHPDWKESFEAYVAEGLKGGE